MGYFYPLGKLLWFCSERAFYLDPEFELLISHTEYPPDGLIYWPITLEFVYAVLVQYLYTHINVR